MTLPASPSDMRLDSRSRRKYAPSSKRSTVGLPVADGTARLWTGPPEGPAIAIMKPPIMQVERSRTSTVSHGWGPLRHHATPRTLMPNCATLREFLTHRLHRLASRQAAPIGVHSDDRAAVLLAAQRLLTPVVQLLGLRMSTHCSSRSAGRSGMVAVARTVIKEICHDHDHPGRCA